MESWIQQTAEMNDIEFSPTPTGFILRASLSSYWSVPMIIFLSAWTGGFAYGFVRDWANLNSASRIGGVMFVACIGGIFWWMALLRAIGTQSVIVNIPQVEVKVGIGALGFNYRFDSREIASITEGDGTISGGEGGPPYKAVILRFSRPIQGRFSSRSKFAFGHFMTATQRRFTINRLHETLGIAT
jgi:hypothetical protein